VDEVRSLIRQLRRHDRLAERAEPFHRPIRGDPHLLTLVDGGSLCPKLSEAGHVRLVVDPLGGRVSRLAYRAMVR
jgi:hypothetical protein